MLSHILASLLLLTLGSFVCEAQNTKISEAEKDSIQRQYKLDPNVKPELRVSSTPLHSFAGQPISPHILTQAERQIVAIAFEKLPPLYQQVLKDHLASISFVDNNSIYTAMTYILNSGNSYNIFNITIRAGVLKQTVSQWLTEKQHIFFDTAQSKLAVSVEAGQLNAFVYVLLHEATHVVDGVMNILPFLYSNEVISTHTSEFTKGIWRQSAVFEPRFAKPLLEQTRFRMGGKRLPIIQAREVYKALKQTPFVSLYSTSSWYEDLAEYITVYHLTHKLKQPFRIILRDGDKNILNYQPMKSKLVQSRISFVQRFYLDNESHSQN